MDNKVKMEKAMDIVLACPRCRTPTDAQFNKESNQWFTYCECGRRSRHDNNKVINEVIQVMKTLPKK